MPSLKKRIIQQPDGILKNQSCTVCKKRLPLKNYPFRKIRCDRCSKKHESVDKFSTYIMFPCVNGYEGCHNMLEYKNVSEHQKHCIGSLFACPICPTEKYKPISVLHLIDHFGKQHNKYASNNPVIHTSKSALSKQYYIHFDPHKNLMFLIFLLVKGNCLSVNVTVNGQGPRFVQQQVKLFQNYPEKNLFTSLWRECTLWNSDFKVFDISLDNDLDFFSLEFLFKYSVDSVNWFYANNTKVDSLGIQKNILAFPQTLKKSIKSIDVSLKGAFPKFYLQNLEDDSLKKVLENPTFSSCGKYILDESGKNFIDIQCSFCECYFPLIHIDYRGFNDSIYKCSSCSFSVCTDCRWACYLNPKNAFVSEMICPDCFSEMQAHKEALCFQLDYYCRFNCGQYFRGCKLGIHDFYFCKKSDISCSPYEEPSELIIEKYFGPDNIPWSRINTKSSFSIFRDPFYRLKIFYCIDQRGFQYTLDFKYNDFTIDFIVSHEYDPSKIIVTVKMIENNTLMKPLCCQKFSVKPSDSSQFAIIFKERS